MICNIARKSSCKRSTKGCSFGGFLSVFLTDVPITGKYSEGHSSNSSQCEPTFYCSLEVMPTNARVVVERQVTAPSEGLCFSVGA